MRTFLISDTHFSHANILTFKKENGTLLREGFDDIHHHDETLIENWNKIVSTQDKVYHLGDVGFRNWTILSNILSRLNGTKVLIKGNHDNFKATQYLQVFKDIRSYHILDKAILSHIPVHPDSLSRWKVNFHGHTHGNNLPDKRYINLSVEQTNYTPVDFEELREEWLK